MAEQKRKPRRAEGGRARAEKLSAEQRRDIARQGAKARWDPNISKAKHTGDLHIGELTIPCAVLPDGTRVLSQRGVGRALGRSFGGSDWKRQATAVADGAGQLPFFLSANSLRPFISNDLLLLVTNPIPYRHGKGGGAAYGIKAEALPQICDVWLKAREAGVLAQEAQLLVAQKAEILMRGLAHVGVVALVDEATGFQEVRDQHALQAILDAFLRQELAAWAKRFPDEFYEHIFRLRGWQWRGRQVNPPHAVAHYTKDLVYARLAPGVLDELERRNPADNGHRRSKHHQWLSDDAGVPALSQHLHAVVTLMRVSESWDQFKLMIDKAHPKRGDTLQLPLMSDPSPIEPQQPPAQ